jgi:hypothetical protein
MKGSQFAADNKIKGCEKTADHDNFADIFGTVGFDSSNFPSSQFSGLKIEALHFHCTARILPIF